MLLLQIGVATKGTFVNLIAKNGKQLKMSMEMDFFAFFVYNVERRRKNNSSKKTPGKLFPGHLVFKSFPGG